MCLWPCFTRIAASKKRGAIRFNYECSPPLATKRAGTRISLLNQSGRLVSDESGGIADANAVPSEGGYAQIDGQRANCSSAWRRRGGCSAGVVGLGGGPTALRYTMGQSQCAGKRQRRRMGRRLPHRPHRLPAPTSHSSEATPDTSNPSTFLGALPWRKVRPSSVSLDSTVVRYCRQATSQTLSEPDPHRRVSGAAMGMRASAS